MTRFVLTTLVTAASLLIVDFLVPGLGIAALPVALFAALSIGIVNGSIKPLIRLFSLPITLLSFGSFSLVINSFCLWFASLFVPGFTIHGFFSFLIAPIALSLVSSLLMDFALRHGADEKLAALGRKLNLTPGTQTVADLRSDRASYVPASKQVITVEAVEVG